MKNKKDFVIIILVIIIIILGVLCALFATDTIKFHSNITKKDNLLKETKNEKESDKDETQLENTVELNNYIGKWYQQNYKNQESITIKNVSDSTVTMNIFFYRLASMQDTTVTINGNQGTFEERTEDGMAKITGIITFDENKITIEITSSEIANNVGKKYVFDYKEENSTIDLEKYTGVWYQQNYKNQESITIKNVSNNTVTMNIFFYRLASMQDTTVTINGNQGTFEERTEDGMAKVTGIITFDENKITIEITSSEIANNVGKKYIFDYKEQ